METKQIGTLVACLAVAMCAQAQSVTMYGLVDSGVEVNRSGLGTNHRMIAGGSLGSRLGFRGSEDLGGGYRAVFKLEQGILINTGALGQGGRGFGREASVGIGSPYGTVLLGRLPTPYFTSQPWIDAFQLMGGSLIAVTRSGTASRQLLPLAADGRADNAVMYLFRAVAARNLDVRTDSNVLELLRMGDRIEGVVVANGSRTLRYRARKGVMLSTGRHPFQKEDSDGWRLAAGVRASTYTTSLIGVGMMNMRVPGEDYPDGFPAYRVNYETYMPHSLVVNRFGERFGNESFFQDIGNTFNQFDTWEEHCFRNIPCYLVFDQNALDKYSFAGLPPGNGNAQGLDWVPRAGSLAELAGMLQIDAGRLQTTVSRFNELARARKDEDFKRSPISLGVLDKPPFFAIRFGTEPGGSLVIDPVQASTKVSMSPDGQAMDYQSGDPIHGLYSSGTLATGRLRTARKVVCVGAGVVGMEVAASARKLGCDVTVVERDEQPMRRCLDAAQANFLRQQHESAGVRFHFGVNVRGISGAASSASSIHLDATELPADCVVAGIGMVRNSEIASASGIHVDDGILVDECGRTSVSNIFAAGDVAAFYSPAYCRVVRLESWQHAMDHGSAVGRCMAGDSAPYDEIPWFWTQQHDVNIHVTGFAAGAARTTVRTVTARSFIAFHTNADGHLVGVTSTGPRRDARAAAALIRLRARLDVEEMASPAKSLAMLVAERTRALRAFRDLYLRRSALGKWLVGTYYSLSPRLCAWLESRPTVLGWVRPILRALAHAASTAVQRKLG